MNVHAFECPNASPATETPSELSFTSPHTWRNRLGRGCWGIVWTFFFRFSPRLLFGWRNFLLKCFGAKIGPRCAVYPSCKVWAPWNLEMGEESCLGEGVDCYCVAKIYIGSYVTISQYSHLCTASHDITSPGMRLVTAPIAISDKVWVCAGAYIGPGISIGEGAVTAARAVVVRNVDPWAVVGGNPARFIKVREMKSA